MSKCSSQSDFTPSQKVMGYYINHVTDVDVLMTSIEINMYPPPLIHATDVDVLTTSIEINIKDK
jgi:hypothetical protein